jgi:hypothetical protein
MKTIVLATVLALTAAAPALAKSSSVQHVPASHHAMVPQDSFAAPDPYGVYIHGEEIGRDPDANIRSTLGQEYLDEEMGG